ncbi:MAG TPA: hypothetical protein VF212_02125 [Longimicrobiales bacterium]
MRRHDRRRGPRPIPVTDAVRDLIRKTAAERPAEDAPPAPPGRTFTADGQTWIARIAGEAIVGTGAFASAALLAVRFHRADEPDRPLREALIPRGRFELLYDDELAALLRTARPLDAERG